MKKLFYLIILVAGSFSFNSCSQVNAQPKGDKDYKPLYLIVKDNDISKLQTDVINNIKIGYKLAGGITIIKINRTEVFAQTMYL